MGSIAMGFKTNPKPQQELVPHVLVPLWLAWGWKVVTKCFTVKGEIPQLFPALRWLLLAMGEAGKRFSAACASTCALGMELVLGEQHHHPVKEPSTAVLGVFYPRIPAWFVVKGP